MQEALHTDVEVDRRRAGIDQPDRDVLRLVTQSIPLQEAERLTRVFGDVPVDALAAVDARHMLAFELVDRGWSIIPPLLYGRGIKPAQDQRKSARSSGRNDIRSSAGDSLRGCSILPAIDCASRHPGIDCNAWIVSSNSPTRSTNASRTPERRPSRPRSPVRAEVSPARSRPGPVARHTSWAAS